jgi:hypothetical protein
LVIQCSYIGIKSEKLCFVQSVEPKTPITESFAEVAALILATLRQLSVEICRKINRLYVDRKGKIRSNDPNQIYSSAIKNLIMGVGFLVISIVLLTTNVAGGHNWWWAMLFPAFSMLASGVSQMAKVKRIEKQGNATAIQQNTLPINQVNTALPPIQTEFIKQQGSIYDTGNLIERPPSVVENTTKLLKLDDKE